MRLIFLSALAGTVLLTSMAASAQHRGAPLYDRAEVVRVDPIIDVIERPVYHDECWDEPVTYREPPRYVQPRGPRAPAVMGGIIGGVLGNQVGRGAGREAATAAGAMLGYSMVRDAQSHGGHYQPGREYTRYERRCARHAQPHREERINGYDVTYRYRGRIYHTVTDYPPGQFIQVRVDVSPVP